MTKFDFSDTAIDALRMSVCAGLSEYRFRHIAMVEQMIVRLGALYLPDEIPMLRAAALLHDFTKELSVEEHERILAEHGILKADSGLLSSKLYHAVTAACTVPDAFPHFASPALLDAVRYHTTGRRGMSIAEMLLYLADYIDESRTFDDCVALRRAFWDADPAKMPEEDRLRHLYRILILSVDKTVLALLREGSPISPDSIDMRNDLLLKI
jgi:nicotinate-nucleotide adenylyltransferase